MEFEEISALSIMLFLVAFGLTYLFLWWFPSSNDFRVVITVSVIVLVTSFVGMVVAQFKT